MRSTPKDSGQTRKLWAYVGSGGNITLGSGGLRVAKTGTGQYTVNLPFVSPLGVGVIVTTNPAAAALGNIVSASTGSFVVSTFNPSTGANTDSAFTVEVNLP